MQQPESFQRVSLFCKCFEIYLMDCGGKCSVFKAGATLRKASSHSQSSLAQASLSL